MKTLQLLLLVSTILTVSGCATILHPIEKTDIFRMKPGQSYTCEKEGWFLSDIYVKEVAKAKVER